MPERIRHASIYRAGRKVAMCSGSTYDHASGDEAQIADEGYVGHSDGAPMSKLSCDVIVPVRGIGVDFVSDLLNKKYVDMSIALLDGKIHRVSMRCLTGSFTSDPKAGTLTAKFEFEGGKPEIVG